MKSLFFTLSSCEETGEVENEETYKKTLPFRSVCLLQAVYLFANFASNDREPAPFTKKSKNAIQYIIAISPLFDNGSNTVSGVICIKKYAYAI